MRVLHVMEATIGGTRRHLVDVARGQLARGLDVQLAVAATRDPDFPGDLELLRAEGAGVHVLPMVREIRPGRDWADVRRLAALLRELRPEIVHTHSSKGGVLGRLASLRTGIGARVHTPHTFAFLFGALFSPWKRALFRQIEARLARRTDRLIAVSESEARTFADSGVVPPDRVRVVPNGLDPAPFEAAAALDARDFDLDPARPLAAVVGLVYAAKGQDLALEALTRPGLEDLQLLLAGPGELDETRERVRALGLADRVRVLGPRRDVPRLLATIDFLLLPSRWEGMPYIMLEAMASARPVVATPVDGARDLVVHEETGRLAAAIDADSIAAELRAMLALDESRRRALGEAGRARMRAEFTAERMVDGLIDVYGEVLAARGEDGAGRGEAPAARGAAPAAHAEPPPAREPKR